MTVLAMLCGCLTVIDGKESPVSLYALAAFFVSALLWTSHRACCGGFKVGVFSDVLWFRGSCGVFRDELHVPFYDCMTVVCV